MRLGGGEEKGDTDVRETHISWLLPTCGIESVTQVYALDLEWTPQLFGAWADPNH